MGKTMNKDNEKALFEEMCDTRMNQVEKVQAMLMMANAEDTRLDVIAASKK